MLEQINGVFISEANELLDNLEGELLTLEGDPENKEVIAAVFRAMHTIKGSSGMFGFTAITTFTHEVESALDLVRNGTLPVTNALINLLLITRDHIRQLLNAGTDVPDDLIEKSNSLIDSFKSYTKNDTPRQNADGNKQPAAEQAATETTWRIKFKPSINIMLNGTRPELLIKELTEMGKATVIPFCQEIPVLSELESEQCYFFWDIILTTRKTENDIRDVFIFLDNDSSFQLEKIDLDTSEQNKLGEILINRGELKQEDLDLFIQQQKKIGQILVDNKIVSPQQVESALAEQEHLKKLNSPQGALKGSSPAVQEETIRVNSEKLDQLVDLVGELVTFNARLSQLAKAQNLSLFTGLSEQCERLVVSLRDNTMEMRMQPIGTLFTHFRRLVRDLSEELGKKIALVIEGAETELDKTVIDKLNDPLIHLIRNCIDHGIELPDAREAAGKDREGKVTLSARHAGSFVEILISDDGAGLNRDAIKKKALEKGLISDTDHISNSDIDNLIFLPGFSTAKVVTAVSGRGVGMDVVKRDISGLGGTVTIESEAGKGSRFILKLPLTLAIIDGMLVVINSIHYIIPLSAICECLAYTGSDSDQLFPEISLRSTTLTCIDLRKFFNCYEPVPANRQIVVVANQELKMGIIVDKILGEHQTVIKPIGSLFRNCIGLNGATILGDGSVALIVDILKLFDTIHTTENTK
jgi:two-component system, chemotaxis family, sensor kinase CheA